MEQAVRTGPGCFCDLPELLAEHAVNRILVVHGRSSLRSSGAESVVSGLAGVQVDRFSEVAANPDLETVERCGRSIAERKPDLVLAVGGGSAIDTAKGAIAFASGASEEEILANRFDPKNARTRLWAAPTTAGSGSEATHFAVLYKGDAKYSLAHPALKPGLVFLDPDLTASCPPALVLASGADAVCQAVESFWSKGATSESRGYAVAALPVLLGNLLAVSGSAADPKAREAMLDGAHLAGMAIDISKTTAGHALSYGLTARYDLQHGLAVLAVMGPLVRLMSARGAFSERTALDDLFAPFGPDFPSGLASFRDQVFSRLGSAVRSAAAGDDGPGAVTVLSAAVNVERLSNHPIRLSDRDISGLYREILEDLGAVTRTKGHTA